MFKIIYVLLLSFFFKVSSVLRDQQMNLSQRFVSIVLMLPNKADRLGLAICFKFVAYFSPVLNVCFNPVIPVIVGFWWQLIL